MTTDTRHDALPRTSLLVLGAATFTMVTAEMLPTAVLPQMSTGLGVDESRTGLLVSFWAAVVVVLSFPLVRLTARFDRRSVIAGALVVLASASVVTALAPTYAVALGARILGAAAVGLLWATANAHTAEIVPDRLLDRAVAVVLGGATAGMVLGTPAASLVARAASWRVAFALLAAVVLVVALLVRRLVVAGPGRRAERVAAESSSPSGAPERPHPGRWVAVTELVGVALMGHYGAYTYVTRLVEEPARAVPGGTSSVLLLFGVASWVGVVLAGRAGGRTVIALLVSSAVTAAALAALTTVTGPAPALGVVAAWGLGSGALGPSAQTLVLRLGGPGRRETAGALIPVVFNGGIALGAAAASLVVTGASPAALPLPAAGLVGVSAALLAVVLRGSSSRARSRPGALR
ncbi:MFS transporter [Isoptericola aurantiacus]|uniref:MFS transporter n=1 Tax=Isoptericola aurantiacus TaxID=3377839 RepID=UPI00383BDEBB